MSACTSLRPKRTISICLLSKSLYTLHRIKKNNRIQTKMVSTFSTAVQFVGFFFFPEVHVQLILALILRLKRKNKLQD